MAAIRSNTGFGVSGGESKARESSVDGVPYSINYKSSLVTVGTGLVSKAERDQGWKLKGNARTTTTTQIEEQIRVRNKFAGLKARAAMAATGAPDAQPDGDGAPHWPPPLTIARSRLPAWYHRCSRAERGGWSL